MAEPSQQTQVEQLVAAATANRSAKNVVALLDYLREQRISAFPALVCSLGGPFVLPSVR